MLNPQMTQMSPAGEEHVFLAGRPPMAEYLGAVSSANAGQPVDLAPLAEEWRIANDRVRELERTEVGAADSVQLAPLPEGLRELVAAVLSDERFKRIYGVIPSDIGWIELDRLVVFQKHINLNYVARLQARIQADQSPEAIFRLCLPFDQEPPATVVDRLGDTGFAAVSASNDLRVTDVVKLSAEQIQGYVPAGSVAAVVGMVIGYTLNHLSVVAAEGRFILANGSHRAYALRDLGVTHVLCVVRHLSRREELPMFFGDGDVTRSADAFLKDPRPPLLRDYFDERLRTVIRMPVRNRQVRVQFAKEEIDVPAG